MSDPAALSLAEKLAKAATTTAEVDTLLCEEAAALIRSLQAENERLRDDPKFITRMLLDDYEQEVAALRERLAATEDFTDIVIDALEAADKELTMLQDRGHDHVRSDVLDRVRQVLDRLNELNEPSPE